MSKKICKSFENILQNTTVDNKNIHCPKISIIVPAYNSEKFIDNCIQSLVEQTVEDIEIIIIDDGSFDNTPNLLKRWQNKDKRIKIITQTNQKQGSARNRGIEIAQGEYIGFIDSDDWVETDYFECLYLTAKHYNCDIVTTNILKHNKKYTKYNIFKNKYNVAETIFDKVKLCEDKSHRFFYVLNKLYKTSFIKTNNILFNEGCYFEDVMFSAKAIYYANKIVYCPETEYHYIENPQSTINSKDNQEIKKEDHIKAYLELHHFAKDNSIKLPERLNYTEVSWKGMIKIYQGTFKRKVSFMGILPIWIEKI